MPARGHHIGAELMLYKSQLQKLGPKTLRNMRFPSRGDALQNRQFAVVQLRCHNTPHANRPRAKLGAERGRHQLISRHFQRFNARELYEAGEPTRGSIASQSRAGNGRFTPLRHRREAIQRHRSMPTAGSNAETVISPRRAASPRWRRWCSRRPLYGVILAGPTLLAGCSSDVPPVVTTSDEAISIAVEQCGNEFRLGKPSETELSGEQWTVSWPTGRAGPQSGPFSATIDSELGVLTSCQSAPS